MGESVMLKHNPYCCGYHCTSETEEVRVLPYGGGDNVILCNACFRYELNYRRDEIRRGRQFELPAWSDLELYDHSMTLQPTRTKYLTHKRGVGAMSKPLIMDREHEPIRAFLLDIVDWFECNVKPNDWPDRVREAKKSMETTKQEEG
jgi:hypothetical protein